MHVFVTRQIPEAGIDLLKSRCNVRVSELDRDLTPEELVRMSQGAEGLVTMLVDRIDGPVLDRLPSVRIVANFAVGYDNIDVPAATERKVLITNTPGAMVESTADIAMGLILCVARRLVEGDRLVRRGGFKGFYPLFFLGSDLQDKVLGIYGMGRIGTAVARRARPFGLNVVYHNRNRLDPAAEQSLGVRYVSFEDLLRTSDYLSIHAPLTSETRHRFTLEEMRRMKPTAFLVNTARGPLVKEDDLVTALEQGTLAGAGLDVFEAEPQVHEGLKKLENAVLLPHVGSATLEVRRRMALMAAENIVAFAQGRTPPNLVNSSLA